MSGWSSSNFYIVVKINPKKIHCLLKYECAKLLQRSRQNTSSRERFPFQYVCKNNARVSRNKSLLKNMQRGLNKLYSLLKMFSGLFTKKNPSNYMLEIWDTAQFFSIFPNSPSPPPRNHTNKKQGNPIQITDMVHPSELFGIYTNFLCTCPDKGIV